MGIADVRDKAALVIGGTRGIGRAIVERFAESGAEVCLTGRASELAASVGETYGQPVSGVGLDVTVRVREVYPIRRRLERPVRGADRRRGSWRERLPWRRSLLFVIERKAARVCC